MIRYDSDFCTTLNHNGGEKAADVSSSSDTASGRKVTYRMGCERKGSSSSASGGDRQRASNKCGCTGGFTYFVTKGTLTWKGHNEECISQSTARREKDEATFASWKAMHASDFAAAAANMASLANNYPAFKPKSLQSVGKHYLQVEPP